MPKSVKVTVHHGADEPPRRRPSPGVLAALYIAGGVVLVVLIGLFAYLLTFHGSQEQTEVEAVVNHFVGLVNRKETTSAMQMIDAAWYQVTNQRETQVFLEQVQGLGTVKLDRHRAFSSEGVEGTVAYEISYNGHVGAQAAEISFRLIRRGQVLMVQAFRLE